MENQLNKPLYALTIGEFIQLIQETVTALIPAPVEPKPYDSEEHFTIDQLKEFLNCSKVTLHNYKRRGLPYFRMGRKLIFKKSEVLEFMRQNVKRLYGRSDRT